MWSEPYAGGSDRREICPSDIRLPHGMARRVRSPRSRRCAGTKVESSPRLEPDREPLVCGAQRARPRRAAGRGRLRTGDASCPSPVQSRPCRVELSAGMLGTGERITEIACRLEGRHGIRPSSRSGRAIPGSSLPPTLWLPQRESTLRSGHPALRAEGAARNRFPEACPVAAPRGWRRRDEGEP